jgi:hypothetical protein
MAAANKVAKLIVGQGGFLSTPAVSNLIRKHLTRIRRYYYFIFVIDTVPSVCFVGRAPLPYHNNQFSLIKITFDHCVIYW